MIDEKFDPMTGEGAPVARFRLDLQAPLPEHFYASQWLPYTMSDDPMVEALRRTGSVTEAARSCNMAAGVFAERYYRLRLLHDFPFWAANLVRIKRKGGGEDIPFVLNYGQRKLVSLLEEMRLAGKPIRVVLLKARQWGGSTCTQMYIAWLQLMHRKGLNSLILAHQNLAGDEIKDMYDRMLDHYPKPLLFDEEEKPTEKIVESVGRSGIKRVIPRNCKIKISSAERPDACRGGDYNLVHLSEVGIWRTTQGKNPDDIVRSACSGVLLEPLTMIVMESTANGTGTFFHREYMAAKQGESQFRSCFVAWHEIEIYRLKLSEAEREELLARLQADKESDADTSRRASGRYLWRLYSRGVSLEALAWYIAERAKYSDQAQMAAEYPSDDIEAFAHSGTRVFDRDAVERLRENCREPLRQGEVVSYLPDGVEGCLSDLHFAEDAQGGLKIWEEPDGFGAYTDRYIAVVDIGGRSLKSDWSVITVFDRLPMLGSDGGMPPSGEKVVAQWRGHCDIDLLAWRAARIARWYADALLVIESNTIETREPARVCEGEQSPFILMQIKDMYENLYERGGVGDEIGVPRPTRLGFHTNTSTKPAIISNLVKIVREGLYTERDNDTLEEMLRYERKENGSYGAIPGAHDDLLMTRAIALYVSRFEMEMPQKLSDITRKRGYNRGPNTESSLF